MAFDPLKNAPFRYKLYMLFNGLSLVACVSSFAIGGSLQSVGPLLVLLSLCFGGINVLLDRKVPAIVILIFGIFTAAPAVVILTNLAGYLVFGIDIADRAVFIALPYLILNPILIAAAIGWAFSKLRKNSKSEDKNS